MRALQKNIKNVFYFIEKALFVLARMLENLAKLFNILGSRDIQIFAIFSVPFHTFKIQKEWNNS